MEQTNYEVNTTAVTPKLPRQKALLYGAGEIGQQTILQFMAMYMLFFFTNVFGIGPGVAGTIMLAARIWDALNDPLEGMIIDRTRSRLGKCRPYLIYGAIPSAIILALLFFTPNIDNTGKIIWAAVFYILQGTIYTLTDTSYTTLLPRVARTSQERVSMQQSRGFTAGAMGAIAASSTFPLVNALGGGDMQRGFFLAACVYGVILAGGYLFTAWTYKGYDAPTTKGLKSADKKEPMIKHLTFLVKNPVWRITTLSALLYYMAYLIFASSIVYYVTDSMKIPDYIPLISFASLIGIMGSSLIVGFFTKRIGKANTSIGGLVIIIVCLLSRLILNDSIFPVMLGAVFIQGIAIGFPAVLIIPEATDAIEYGEWKFGVRSEALTVTGLSFITKLALGLGPAIIGWTLDATKYVPNAVSQPEAALNALRIMNIIVPMCIFAAMLLIQLKYRKYEREMPNIREELMARQVSQTD